MSVSLLYLRSWRQLVEKAKYWKGATLSIQDKLVFSSQRINSVKKLEFADNDLSLLKTFLNFVAKHPDYVVKSLHCESMNLSAISPEILGQALGRVQNLELYKPKLTTVQLIHILTSISSSFDLKLQKFSLFGPQSTVPADILALALVRIKDAKLYECKFTRSQFKDFFSYIADCPQSILKSRRLKVAGSIPLFEFNCLNLATKRGPNICVQYGKQDWSDWRKICQYPDNKSVKNNDDDEDDDEDDGEDDGEDYGDDECDVDDGFWKQDKILLPKKAQIQKEGAEDDNLIKKQA